MTDPREPQPPDSPEPPPSQPEGVVEEIRHEIEEAVEQAVEHVPQPIRWTVGKLVRLAVLSLFGLIVIVIVTAVLYVANRTEWAARELTLVINQALTLRSDVVVEIDDIKGNPFTGVRVVNPRIRFRDGDAPPLLEAPQMRVRYAAWSLVRGGPGPIVIEVDQPRLQLGRGADGKLRLPTWKSPPRKGPGRNLDFVLKLHGASLRTPDSTGHIQGIELDGIASVGETARLEVRSLTWKQGPYGSVLQRCGLVWSKQDSVRLEVRELRTRDLTLRGNAAWKSGHAGEAVAHIEFERLRWRWLSRVTRRGDLDVDGEGRVVVSTRAAGSRVGQFTVAGIWDSLAVDVRGGFAWRDGRLRVDPLIGDSKAGSLDGALTWAKEGWMLDAAARKADPSRWQVIGIRNWPAGDLNGRFRYSVDTRGPKHPRLVARLTTSEWTGWNADSATVFVDFTPTAADTFAVLAHRRGGEMTLRAKVDRGGWSGPYTLADFPLDEWPQGRASGIHGTLTSGRGMADNRSGTLRVTGTLEGTVTDWLGIHTARWRMSEMDGRVLPTPDLAARVRLDDLYFLTVHWDSAGSPIRVGDGVAEIPALAVSAGDTVLTMQASAAWDSAGWRFRADSAVVRSSQFHWTADPPFAVSGDPRGVNFDHVVATDGDARIAITGRWAGPGGAYDWTARGERLQLGHLGFPIEANLGGQGSGELRIRGVPGDPRWDFQGRVLRPGARGHAADSIRLIASGAPGRFEIKELDARLDQGLLEARGQVEGMQPPWPDSLTGPGLLRWVTSAPRWSGRLRAERLPLDRLERLVPAARGWKGSVGGTVELAGSPARPAATWNVTAASLAWGDYRVDDAVARGHYLDGRLDVPEFRMTRSGVQSNISGSMAVDLGVGRRPVLPDAPIDWKIDLPAGDLALLPMFVPQIGSARGHFDVSARLSGTARRPRLSGTANIKDGAARLAGREEVMEGVQAHLTLNERQITLDTLTARQRTRQGSTGQVTATGVVQLDSLVLKGYRFDARLRNFTAQESGVYAAVFDGDFVVTDGPRIYGATLPLVVGSARLKRAVVLFDFMNQSQTEQVAAATQPVFWLYRVDLHATDKLRWKPPDADIEFSADLRLEQTPDSLIIYGDMSALRGTYYYLSNAYKIVRADLTFDNVGGVNPKLDVEAVTKVPKYLLVAGSTPGAIGSDERGSENITVTITGRAQEPVIAFETESGAGEAVVLRALTYGPAVGSGDNPRAAQEASMDFADSWVTRNLNRQLSADLSRVFQGYLSDWELSREEGGLFAGQGDLVVGVTSPITSNIDLRYRQRVPGLARPGSSQQLTTTPFERDVAAELRINRFFYVSSELIQRRNLATTNAGASATAPEFNINLKARWEY